MKTRRFFYLLVILAMVAAACGGSDDGGSNDAANGGTETTAPSNDGGGDDDGSTDTTEPSNDDGAETPDPPAVGEEGSFTVNGTEFAVTLLNRCIPFGGEGSSDIDLQSLAQGQGAELFLYGDGDSVEVTVQGGTIQDMFGSIAFVTSQTDENNLSGDRWSGSATLDDALSVADPVSVTWDVMVISEIRDCSL